MECKCFIRPGDINPECPQHSSDEEFEQAQARYKGGEELKNHLHDGCTSNTISSLTTFKGCIVKGALHAHDGWMLIFNCGYALKFNRHGAFWVESKENVEIEVKGLAEALQHAGRI